jgi:hypothetical protein
MTSYELSDCENNPFCGDYCANCGEDLEDCFCENPLPHCGVCNVPLEKCTCYIREYYHTTKLSYMLSHLNEPYCEDDSA